MKRLIILLVLSFLMAACGRLAEQPQIVPTPRSAEQPADATADATAEATEVAVEATVEATDVAVEATVEASVEATIEATEEGVSTGLQPDASIAVVNAGVPANIALGEELFLRGREGAIPCAGCHSHTNDTRMVGPGLLSVAQRAATRVEGMSAAEYLHQSIVDPSAFVVAGYINMMPKDFGTIYTEEEIDALVAFMLSLGQPAPEVAAAEPSAG
jgi:cytochrome c2